MPTRRDERSIESLVESTLLARRYPAASIEHYGSNDPLIAGLIPSKSNGGVGLGRPEFIVHVPNSTTLLVIEIKHGAALHSSLNPTDDPNTATLRASKYAEDGVIQYLRGSSGSEKPTGLREGYDVIGIAVSGEPTSALRDLKITAFRAKRRGVVERLEGVNTIPFADRCPRLMADVEPLSLTHPDQRRFAETLHDFFRDEMELSKDEKPLLVSAIMLALQTDFGETYYKYSNSDEFADIAYTSIEHYLKRKKLEVTKQQAMLETYRLIKTNADVRRNLPRAVAMIDRMFGQHIRSGALSKDSFDIMGHFYREFLRYTGGDKQDLGIVLTPRHICELFVDIAQPRPSHDIVIDICAGTGGFLVAAMAYLLDACGGDSDMEKNVKRKCIGGIEKRANLFTVACANMIIRGDGKSNIYHGDSIEGNGAKTAMKNLHPTVALLNPPYSKANTRLHEFAFVKAALEMLVPNGLCVALVPISCAIGDDRANLEWKRLLLKEHTLEAVMSMPEDLFPGVGSITCIVVMRAHRPHQAGHKSYFGYWRNDGFRLLKGERIERIPGAWETTKANWLRNFRSRSEIPGFSILREVSDTDEWCAEAYLEPDWSTLTPDVVAQVFREFALHKMLMEGSRA